LRCITKAVYTPDARHTYQIITLGDEEKEDTAYSSIKSAKLRKTRINDTLIKSLQ